MSPTPFHATVLTLFPEMFPGPLGQSLAGQALQKQLWKLDTLNIRDYGIGKHARVDETPYGGGAGMLMRADVLDKAIMAARTRSPNATLLYPTPRGRPVQQTDIRRWTRSDAILLCGRYEGVDDRVLRTHPFEEICVGDMVLSGGEIPAMAILDAMVRLLPGVMGADDSAHEESFGHSEDYAYLLEYPHYTRPLTWKKLEVPEVLRNGNHAEIRNWRLQQAEKTTKQRRPDLWQLHSRKKQGT